MKMYISTPEQVIKALDAALLKAENNALSKVIVNNLNSKDQKNVIIKIKTKMK